MNEMKEIDDLLQEILQNKQTLIIQDKILLLYENLKKLKAPESLEDKKQRFHDSVIYTIVVASIIFIISSLVIITGILATHDLALLMIWLILISALASWFLLYIFDIIS